MNSCNQFLISNNLYHDVRVEKWCQKSEFLMFCHQRWWPSDHLRRPRGLHNFRPGLIIVEWIVAINFWHQTTYIMMSESFHGKIYYISCWKFVKTCVHPPLPRGNTVIGSKIHRGNKNNNSYTLYIRLSDVIRSLQARNSIFFLSHPMLP